MIRFVAVACDNIVVEENARLLKRVVELVLSDRQLHWDTVLKGCGLTVLQAGGKPPVRTDERDIGSSGGVIIGCAFNRSFGNSNPTPCSISQNEASLAISTNGRSLIERLWGRYVAFGFGPQGHFVVREPSGTIPCYHISLGSIDVYVSDIQVVRRLLGYRFSINFRFIAEALTLPRVSKTTTALEGIDEVLPGEYRSRCCAIHSRFAWRPSSFAASNSRNDVDYHAELVSTAVGRVVRSLSDHYGSVLHCLGGLDSSIVLAYLVNSLPGLDLKVVNFRTEDTSGDETRYAQIAADHMGVDLKVMLLDALSVPLDELLKCVDGAAPLGFLDLVGYSAGIRESDALDRVNAIFTGVGGDNVFLQGADIFPALDINLSSQNWSACLKAVIDSARYSRRSVWDVGLVALRERLRPSNNLEYVISCLSDTPAGVNREFLEGVDITSILHPGLLDCADLPKGKILQIVTSCFCPVEYYYSFFKGCEIERVDIFFHQPIVETCLAVPTNILALKGLDRGFERYAFASVLPEAIVRRRTKGAPQQIYDVFAKAHSTQIKEYLLDGVLYSNGCIDSKAVEDMSNGIHDPELPAAIPLINLMQYEAWARSWS
jgi:asparagine synthase (glutamine-hydrolysing)